MGMLRETRNGLAVVHPPPVLSFKVASDLSSSKGNSRTELIVAGWICIVVVHAEQERVEGRPGWSAQRDDADYRFVAHNSMLRQCAPSQECGLGFLDAFG